jgi:cubilin
VYDGDDVDGVPLFSACQSTVHPVTQPSSGNYMVITFNSTAVGSKGFSLSYSTLHGGEFCSVLRMLSENLFAGCGGDISGTEGVITSMNYPEAYANSQTCLWRITLPPSSRINLTFESFILEGHSTCRYDWVEVSCFPCFIIPSKFKIVFNGGIFNAFYI